MEAFSQMPPVPEASGATEHPGTERIGPRFAHVVGRLTVVNSVITLLSLLTGPLQARALGPSGRGVLAAILVPTSVAPLVAMLGLNTYTLVESARRRPVNVLVGSIGGTSIIVGTGFAALGVPLSALIAHGRATVHTFVLLGFFILPLTLAGGLLMTMLIGLQRWRAVTIAMLTQPILATLGIVILYVSGTLTVRNVAVLMLASMLLAIVPTLVVLRGAGRPRFVRAVASHGLRFGVKSWVGALASTANLRVDQLLMSVLVSSRQLGLYVIAVTFSGLLSPVTSAIGLALAPRVAAGERGLPHRTLRTTLLLVSGVVVALALVAPTVIPLLFGDAFGGAVPLTFVLLGGAIPFAGVTVLTVVFVSDGKPSIPAVAELIALIITVVGLLLLLGPLGALGAAIVSVAAYTTNFAIQLTLARRYFDLPLRAFILVTRDDLSWALHVLRSLLPGRLAPE